MATNNLDLFFNFMKSKFFQSSHDLCNQSIAREIKSLHMEIIFPSNAQIPHLQKIADLELVKQDGLLIKNAILVKVDVTNRRAIDEKERE